MKQSRKPLVTRLAADQAAASELGTRTRERNVRRELKPYPHGPCLDNPVVRLLRRVPEVPA